MLSRSEEISGRGQTLFKMLAEERGRETLAFGDITNKEFILG